MAVLASLPFPRLPRYRVAWNTARAHNWTPTRWRLSTRHLQYSVRLKTLLGLPVYYASDTWPDCVVLETDHGDVVEHIGFGDDEG